MRVVALVSGGKDSCYNMMQCIAAGHTIVALANMRPRFRDELDSYMYQTVGHQGVGLYAEAMGLPLIREFTSGVALDQTRYYCPTRDDEVEDLYTLLERVKNELAVEAVAVGAILSDYQRIRVESVCARLGLVSLSYLWRRNQKELLQEMIDSGVEAVIIKVAALGLEPNKHLGMTLREIQPHLLLMHEKYGLNVCGEGGEYETFTLDCPLFKKKLVIDGKDLIMHTDEPVAPVGYLNLSLRLEDKPLSCEPFRLPESVRSPDNLMGDLSDSVFNDQSDAEDEAEELEAARGRSGDDSDPPSDEPPPETNSGFRFPLPDHSVMFGNRSGWYFIGGVVGHGEDTAAASHYVLKKVISMLSAEELEPHHVVSVNIYLRDMAEYDQLNRAYREYFGFSNPPTRVCVQCPLPKDCALVLDAVVHRTQKNPENSPYVKERETLHVQSISHWAPANIGPYSQSVKVGEVIATCGMIALIPGSMQLSIGGPRAECHLALRHVHRVLRAVHRRTNLRSVYQAVCYTTVGSAVGEARRQLERRTAGALVQYAVVEALPRGATFEWHSWAHTDNNRFEYEETGCTIGDYKVAIARRWNYENTVGAFVCYVSTSSSTSSCQLSFPSEEACESHRAAAARMPQADIEATVEYALKKLLTERRGNTEPAVKLRVFYQVWSAPPPAVIIAAVAAARARVCPGAACTVLPVLALHNAFTLMSISGMRFDE